MFTQEGKVLHSILQFVYMKIYKVLVNVTGTNRTNLNAFIFNDSSILFLSNYKDIYNMQLICAILLCISI